MTVRSAVDRGSRDPELIANLSRILDLVGHMNGAAGLAETMEAVAQGIVAATGFRTVCINHMRADGRLEVTTIVGSDAVRKALLGVIFPPESIIEEMSLSEPWGRLRFSRHGNVPVQWHAFIPDIPVPTDPNGWHPDDGLLMPLYSDGLSGGELVGIVSVDEPEDGLLPDEGTRQLLQLLATQAEIAINNARLLQRLRASEASLLLAFDAAVVGMAVVSLDPRRPLEVLQSNAALGALAEDLGRPPLASLADLLEESDEEHDPLVWLPSFALGGPTRIQKRFVRHLEVRWIEITGTVMHLHRTEPLQAIIQVEDITARFRSDQGSQRSKAGEA